VARFVADLGNTRLKVGRLGSEGLVCESVALSLADEQATAALLDGWRATEAESAWAISSVNPPLAECLRERLGEHVAANARWYRSAADVPVRHTLANPERTGADRALAVRAAMRLQSAHSPGLVIMCGTAITVEHISVQGVWQGGAIAPGIAVSARSLHELTALLPAVHSEGTPLAWADATEGAIASGLFWGAIGTIRELISRQSDGVASPWVVWTGGDSPMLAPWVSGPSARIVPDLVLDGLAQVAFPGASVTHKKRSIG
jgi:type III pantothenate kinase